MDVSFLKQKKKRTFARTTFLAALLGLSFVFIFSPFQIAQAALAIDPSTPARTSGSDPRTTASFSPPANSLLLAMVSSDSALGSNPTIAITNNGAALTWNLIAERSKGDTGAQDGEASAFYAILPTARTGMTVTATITDQNQRISIKVYVITGHNPVSPIGAVGEGSSTTNNITPIIYTSTTAGSLGFGVSNDWSAAGLPTSTDQKDAFTLAGYISGLSAYKSASTSVVGTPVTINFDAAGTGAVQWNWVGFEVKPNGPPDTTPPTVSLTAPLDGSTVSGSTVTVSANASDNVGVVGVQFKLDGANLSTEDITSPYSITWNTTTITNGSHVLTAVARDAAGNTATATNVNVTVSNPPLISGISASSITQTSALINWTTNVPADSQINYGTVLPYDSSTVLDPALVTSHSQLLSGLVENTTYHYQVLSRDATGVLASSSDNTFTTLPPPDTTPPTVSLTAPLDGTTVSGSISVSATASDNVGVVGVQFKLDGANLSTEDITSPYSITWNTTAVTNGSHVLTAVARDAAGNTAITSDVSVMVNNPPIISGINVASITYNSAVISWNTNVLADSQIMYGTTINYDLSTTLDTTLITSHSQTLSGLVSSTLYHYEILSKDGSGVLAVSSDGTFTTAAPPDTTPPTVSLTAPLDGSTVSGSAVTVSASASDNVGVVGVQFKLDGASLGVEDTTSPYSISWDTTTTSNGSHVLTAVARDAAGNTATAANVNVTVNNTDTTPPIISSVAASSITTTGATITWTTNEASDSQVEYGTTISYGSSSALNVSLLTSHSISLGGLAASTLYHYRVKSRDAAGNLATSGDVTFTTTATGTALTVNGSQKFQTIDGFGTNINSLSWNNDNSAAAIDMLADTMGQTTWRVVFDMEDWESTNDNADPNTPNWTYYNALYSNTKFQNLWGTLHYLNQKGFNSTIALSFMGITPSWMGGATINTAQEDEAVEMITTLVYYARNTANVQFGMLDPFNESDWGHNEGPTLSSTQYVRLLHKISDKLDTMGLGDIRFMGPNTADVNSGVNTYMPEMMADSVVVNKTDHFAFHSYSSSTGGADNAIKNSAYPNKNFWMTEYTTATDAFSLLAGNPSGLMIWEGFDSVFNHAILNGFGSAPGNDDSFGPAPLAYNSLTHTYTPRLGFYQNEQIFKFVPPGSVRISAVESNGNVTEYAFYNQTNGRFTIVGQNTGSAVTFNTTLQNLPSLTALEFYKTDLSSNFQKGSDIAVSGNAFSFVAPANSVFTLTGLAFIDAIPPSNPGSLAGSGNIGNAVLTWSAATDNIGVTAYNIYRSTVSGFTAAPANKIGQTTGLTYTDFAPAGTYYYLITAQDAAGNIGPVSNEASAIITSDTTPPTVSLTAPLDGANVTGSITVSANASDDVGVAGVQFKLDGNNLGTEDTVSPYAISWDSATTTNGSHVLTAVARDNAGNTATAIIVNVTVNNVAAPINLVQKFSNITSGASSLATTFTSSVTQGNFILVTASGWPNGGTIAVTDSRGNAYTRAGNIQLTSGNSFTAIFYAKNVIGGTDTVTLSNGVSGTQLSVTISEFSGVDRVSPLDSVVGVSGSGTTPSSGNLTPTVTGDLVIGTGTHDVSNIVTSPGSGFTMLAIATEEGTSHQPLATEYRVINNTSPLPANFSLSSGGPWAQIGALFKAASQ